MRNLKAAVPLQRVFKKKKKFGAIVRCDIFHVDFKYMIYFALALWEKTKPVSYLDGNTILIFWSYQNFWQSIPGSGSQWPTTQYPSINFRISSSLAFSFSVVVRQHFCPRIFSSDFWIFVKFWWRREAPPNLFKSKNT